MELILSRRLNFEDCVYLCSTSDNGVSVIQEGEDRVYLWSTTDNGVSVIQEGEDRVYLWSTSDDGGCCGPHHGGGGQERPQEGPRTPAGSLDPGNSIKN